MLAETPSGAPSAVTITDSQIRALESEAAKAGDILQVAICRIALATGLTEIADLSDLPHVRADLERMGIVPEHIWADDRARAECARVMDDAAAMMDPDEDEEMGS